MSESRVIPAMSAETAALLSLIRKLAPGDVLTYDTMSAAIGCDVRTRRGALRTARHRALEDDSVHTATVQKVGVKRLDDSGAANTLQSHLRRARSAARRGRATVRRLNVDKIPQTERAAVFARSSLLELIEYGGSAKAQDRALAAVAASDSPDQSLPLRKALAALKEG